MSLLFTVFDGIVTTHENLQNANFRTESLFFIRQKQLMREEEVADKVGKGKKKMRKGIKPRKGKKAE